MDEQNVLELDEHWNDAYRSGQRERLHDILAADWIGYTAEGKALSRSELIGSSPPPGSALSVGFSRTDVRQFGSTAVVTGEVQVSANGVLTEQRFMRVYSKRSGRWWAVTVQVFPAA